MHTSESDLGTLIREMLSPGAGHVHLLPGPEVQLASEQVFPLSMILHELRTNALKYGALSVPDGIVHLTWRVAADGVRRTLELDWREENRPPVSPPTPALAPS